MGAHGRHLAALPKAPFFDHLFMNMLDRPTWGSQEDMFFDVLDFYN
jgi:hypothetical protein